MALQESWNTDEDAVGSVEPTVWRCQTFLAGSNYSIEEIKWLVYREFTPGTVTVSIRATDEITGKPTGGDLTVDTKNGNNFTENVNGTWRGVQFSSPYELTGGVTYAIVARSADVRVFWHQDTTGPVYTDGKSGYSSDGGNTWTMTDSTTNLFETYGTAVAGDIVLEGTIAGTAALSGTLSSISTLTGTIAASAVLSGNILFTNVLHKSNIHTVKRLVAVGNNEVWYEDV